MRSRYATPTAVWRINAELTQAEAAEALDVSLPTIKKWENGTYKPSFCHLVVMKLIAEGKAPVPYRV